MQQLFPGDVWTFFPLARGNAAQWMARRSRAVALVFHLYPQKKLLRYAAIVVFSV
jgi:hypothetical protein